MYDVIVAGAGPAGSTCARLCAKQGLRTLLLDKDRFPRSKTCAGAVSEQALMYLDFPLPHWVIERECFGARLSLGDRTMEVRKDRRVAVVVSRERFDCFLLEKTRESGAEIREEEKVLSVSQNSGSVQVETEKAAYQARYLVGADGVNSRTALAVRPPFRRSDLTTALVRPVEEPADNGERTIDCLLEMRLGFAPMEYGGVLPRNGNTSAGNRGPVKISSRSSEMPGEFVRPIRMEAAVYLGHLIPLGGIKRRIAHKRVILTGDAAGFADPFSGEGISYAILSGRFAGQAIAKIVTGQKEAAAALAWYEQQAEYWICRNLRAALSMARLVDRFPLLSARIFFDDREPLAKYLDIAAGQIDYRRFLRWMMLRGPFYFFRNSYRRAAEAQAKRYQDRGTE